MGALALSGCAGGSGGQIDASYSGECVVEIEFHRAAAKAEIEAFSRRVERTPHVDRIQVLSREGNIERFRAAVQREGHVGEHFDRLMARARRHAGAVLLVKAEDDGDVRAILRSLEEVPGVVSSVAERDSCHRA